MAANRDPHAWARLGQAIQEARKRKGWTQPELAHRAGVSARSLWDAEHGRVPSGRMPYTLDRIAVQLNWPAGTIDAILAGDAAPGGWQSVDAQPLLDEEAVESALTGAMLRATTNTTTGEIRKAAKIALDELRAQGLLPEQPSRPASNRDDT